MITSYDRGHEIYLKDNGLWYYVDNDLIMTINRPCKRCGKPPTKEGYDACLGHIKDASSCCCGHGVEEPYIISEVSV